MLKFIIELPLREKRTLVKWLLPALNDLSPAELAQPLDNYVTLSKEPEEWTLEPNKKLDAMKAVREITGLGLKEAKDLVEKWLLEQESGKRQYIFRRCL